jgi:type IV pilus assembly protein PilX
MSARSGPRRSRGASLIIGMILLLLMTAVSLTSLKGIKTDEHLTGNLQDRYLAFQAAEAGLREAEIRLGEGELKVFDGTQGLFAYTDPRVPTPFELDATNARTYSETLTGVAQAPHFIVEQLEAVAEEGESIIIGVDYPKDRRASYRITAVGYGGSATTRVVLQSTFRF